MGNIVQIKAVRKQIRSIAQEHLPQALTNEVLQSIEKTLTERIMQRLEVIAENTTKALEDQDKQTKSFRNFLVMDAGRQISREMVNVSVTMLAWQRVLTRRLGIADQAAFDSEVQLEKDVVLKELEAEAAKKAEAEAAVAAAAKAAETPAATTETKADEAPAASSESSA